MAPPLDSKNIEEAIRQVEEYIRNYVYSKVNKKIIENFDVLIDVEDGDGLKVNIEIELDAGPLSERYQKVVDEAVDLAHDILEKRLRG